MAITNGTNLNSIASPQRHTMAGNYVDLSSSGWAQQYLPDLMEKEAEVFGNRTISGFLAQVGAEEAMAADQVVWSEQGRLHISVIGTIVTATGVVTIVSDIDGNVLADGFGLNGALGDTHGIREGDTVIVAGAAATVKCRVTNTDAGAGTFEVEAYNSTDTNAILSDAGIVNAETVTVMVYGSDFGKGTKGQGSYTDNVLSAKSIDPVFKSFTNKPIILKDLYEVSGSDASAIGWVEVSGEDGQNGYMWYLKAAGDQKARFTDYLEMSMIEAVKGVAANSTLDTVDLSTTGHILGTPFGTEGLFAAIEDRGNITTGVTGVNAATDLAEFDAILAEFDKQGAIEENMMFVNRATALAIDDMLASMNSYGAGGTSYGVFDNDEDMALNLGFSGFRRGSYDFYKSDWKYLNDFATRGSINARDTVNAVRGVVVPAGVSSVYDQSLGKNLKRPFLHVRYRASQTESRKLKTWVTGSVGAVTSDLDAMQINMLSERCLITQGANNFMMMK